MLKDREVAHHNLLMVIFIRMILIIGLGNPGEKLAGTRHNIGRDIAFGFVKTMEFPVFRFEKKWNADVSEGKAGKEKTAIVLPNTFMNTSGGAVGPAARFYKMKPKDIFVVHDDADIPLGRGKLSFGKHSAGHKGVESVMRALKTRDFWRFRIGIGGKRDIPAEKLVLKKFTPDEMRLAKKVMKKTIGALIQATTEGPEMAMNNYNH